MKARIGVVDSAKVIEIEIDEPDEFRSSVEAAIGSEDAIHWFTDAKKRTVGVPRGRIAYVEIESDRDGHAIGFSPGG